MNIIASQKFCLWVLGKHQCHLVLIGKPLRSDLHCYYLALVWKQSWCWIREDLNEKTKSKQAQPKCLDSIGWQLLRRKVFCFVNKESAGWCSTVDGIGWDGYISMGGVKCLKCMFSNIKVSQTCACACRSDKIMLLWMNQKTQQKIEKASFYLALLSK